MEKKLFCFDICVFLFDEFANDIYLKHVFDDLTQIDENTHRLFYTICTSDKSTVSIQSKPNMTV